MIRALLLDLDDTLLGNQTEAFMAGYFARLRDYASPVLDPNTFLPNLIQATQTAIGNTDPATTNADVFWESFQSLSGYSRAELEPFFDAFYETEFPHLRAGTQLRPSAARLVNLAHARDIQVVVATNPLFPRVAVEQRLEWAGIPVTSCNFALVTTFENMHAAKPQPAYYREVLDLIGCSPDESLMAGDDWKNDIVPAHEAGLFTYWISDEMARPPDPSLPSGCGSLAHLLTLVEQGWLERLSSQRG